MDPIVLVTGGTGRLGRLVVARLRADGRAVRVLSRHPHGPEDGVDYVIGDLLTGEAIERAVDGASTIVHCAGSAKRDDERRRTARSDPSVRGTPAARCGRG